MVSRCAIFLVLALANSVFCNANVPVLIWNNHRSDELNVEKVSALQQITVPSLQARYFGAFKPNNILMFLQDALSAEDLSSHTSEMEHLSSWMETGQSLYLPNVLQPQQLQHDLVQQGYKVTTLSAGSAVSELKLDPAGNNLVLVKMIPTLTNPSRSRALRKADEVMYSVLSKIGDATDFTIIYTALKNTVEETNDSRSGGGARSASDDEERVRVARSLKEFVAPAPKPPPNFHNGTCILVYFRKNMQISVTGPQGTFSEIPETTINDEAIGTCPEGGLTQNIRLYYNNVTFDDAPYYKLKIAFFFHRKRSYWSSPYAEVTLNKNRGSNDDKHNLTLVAWKDQSVPVGKSYACNAPLVFREMSRSNSSNSSVVELRVHGVQVEAFITKNKGQFGPSWDCIGFFSIGIWAGLFAALLSILILSIGLGFLATIQTMDRFDDPKGKSIMVAQTAD